MSQGEPRGRPQETDTGQPPLQTGRLIDDFVRTAQGRPSSDSVQTNLTDKGSWFHGIDQGDKLTILVFEEGIWVTPESGDQDV